MMGVSVNGTEGAWDVNSVLVVAVVIIVFLFLSLDEGW